MQNQDAHAKLKEISKFLPIGQVQHLLLLLSGEESSYGEQVINSLHDIISTMPVTYEQDGKGDDAIAYLHYFYGGRNYYITEKDMDGGVLQAFGWYKLDGQEERLDYINIAEITRFGAEVEFEWTPRTLREIKAKYD